MGFRDLTRFLLFVSVDGDEDTESELVSEFDDVSSDSWPDKTTKPLFE